MKKVINITLVGIFFLSGALFAEINMVPGNYSVKTVMKMQGMTMPSVKYNQCITKKKSVPNKDDKCKITKQNIKGSVVTWMMKCDGGEFNGRIKYSGKSFAGTMKLTASGQQINYTISGTRIGNCQ